MLKFRNIFAMIIFAIVLVLDELGPSSSRNFQSFGFAD